MKLSQRNITEDFLITFFVNTKIYRVSISELLKNQDDPFFVETLGFSPGFRLPFRIIKNSNDNGYIFKPTDELGFKAYIDRTLINERQIQDGDYVVFKNFAGHSFKILFTALEDKPLNYQKYELKNDSEIYFGRKPTNEIYLNNSNRISREKHFRIRKDSHGNAVVEDLKRSVGLYVNDELVYSKKLEPFDEIYIMGFSMIYLGNSLAVNSFGKSQMLPLKQNFSFKEPNLNGVEEQEFVRTPRVVKTIEKDTVEVDPPPAPVTYDQTPAIYRIGPSITMALMMVISLAISFFTASSGGNGTLVIGSAVMSLGMLIGAILWPTLSRKYQKNTALENERIRTEKYQNYINAIDQDLQKRKNRTIKLLNNRLSPSPQILCTFLDSEKEKLRLWERSSDDSDFLSVRLGVGQSDFNIKLKTPKQTIKIQEDKLAQLPEHLARKYQILRDVPITLDLYNNLTVGVVGKRSEIDVLLQEIILNIIALHSYDEVKLAFITSAGDEKKFEQYKNTPHVWSNDKSVRYFATNEEEVHHIFTQIDNLIKDREEREDEFAGRPSPHFVIIITEPSLVEKEALMRYINSNNERYGITTIFAYGDVTKLPKSCKTIVECDSVQTGYYSRNDAENKFKHFRLDKFDQNAVNDFTQTLVQLPIKRELTTLSIPSSISFLEMYKVGNIHDLDIKSNWDNNKSDRTLAAPVGLMAGGETFDLDIHESYHGCHGLVAGTTGSGKSEFLQAYILSLAVNYSPDEVAFVLVDFKGGDMARPFMEKRDQAALPHLAATISNLSENTLFRALVSFNAEIQSRQRIFNDSARQLGVDKLDINSYQRYYKEGKLDIPLPHLIIIIDEFAQLKSQQPDFLQQLVDIAQVGRSLGIHLILATQKPSGLVDPQIWSNSRFKVCLRVADKQDSLDMINKPDSALIREPGRFYVQIGYDEIFQCVQSGYSGADYTPRERFVSDDELTVQLINHSAFPLESAKLNTSTSENTEKTQLEAVVSEIVNIGQDNNIKVKPLWLDELKDTIPVETLKKTQKGLLTATLGMMDLVRIQRQEPLHFDFVNSGHLGIYGASGMGKTTFLHTLVSSLVLGYGYTPEELNIYALDFGGRNLGYLKNLPHTGEVLYADSGEKIDELFELLQGIIDERKILFEQAHVGSFSAYRSSGKKLPAVLVMIDNYASFHDKFSYLADQVIELISTSSTFGVFFAVTGTTKNSIYYRVADHIPNNIGLRLNDPNAYYDLFNKKPPIFPGESTGRGLTLRNKDIVEFQTALPVDDESESGRLSTLSEAYSKLNAEWKGKRPQKLEADENVTDVEVKQEAPKSRPAPHRVRPRPTRSRKPPKQVSRHKVGSLKPIKEETNSLVLAHSRIGSLEYGMNLEEDFKLVVGVRDEKDLIEFYQGVFNALDEKGEDVVFIDRLDEKAVFKPLAEMYSNFKYISDSDELDAFFEGLKSDLNARLEKKDSIKPLYLILSDFNDVFETLNDEQAAFLRKILQHINKPEYKIFFITGFNAEKGRNHDKLYFNLIVKADTYLIARDTLSLLREHIQTLPAIADYDVRYKYMIHGTENAEIT